MAQFDTAVRRDSAYAQQIDAGLRAHMNSIYGLMGVAMLVTGVVAYVFGQDLLSAMTTGTTAIIPMGLLGTLYSSPMVYVIMFAPLAVVFLFAARLNRMSTGAAQGVFWAFAALMGLSLATIFVRFTGISIAQTFFVTAIAFLSLSLYGYTTKRNLSGMGTFLMMGVIGLIVASLLNMFIFESSALQFAVSVLGLLIFAGLTAYDTQRLKSEYVQMAGMGATGQQLSASAIGGALSLYLNFLNMFMFLLQFMGAARE
ncbi:MAG: BAX inhibitor (BI)-1/YccA family protein [Alphaproteobacteria bacterium HGW-Alphaproteobacteria-8]|nr:MAG: BAX inhibitor (BI)-1/YccA family protein [Alphaproteobacteria bacterium HGW-Alphaproteobacteria-8]